MNIYWWVWVLSNAFGIPFLTYMVYLLFRKARAALVKFTTAKNPVSRTLADRNLKVSGVFLLASLIFLGADGALLYVAWNHRAEPTPMFIGTGTLAVVLGIVLLVYGVYYDLSVTERAAMMAEEPDPEMLVPRIIRY